MGYSSTSISAERCLAGMEASLDSMQMQIETELSNITSGCYNINGTLDKLVTGSQCINEKLDKLNTNLKELTEAIRCHEK